MWKPFHRVYMHAGKTLKTYVWKNPQKKLMIVISDAWLGKPYYRMGYVVELKKMGSLKKLKTSHHYKKIRALDVAKKWKKKIK